MRRLVARRLQHRVAIAAGLCCAVTACTGGSSSTSPRKPTTGSLTVTITAPAGVTPSVSVSGPAGYRTMLRATQTLTALAAGSYTVNAASVVVTGAIVGTAYTGAVSGSPATVAAADTAAATVTYAQQPGSGGLWISSSVNPSTVVEYTGAQLAASSTAAATTTIATGSSSAFGEAFDAGGNLWISGYQGNTITEYAAAQLAASGTPTPAVTLTASSGSLSGPLGIAFDSSGNLWVANAAANTVVEFSASQLAASGSPTPSITIGASAGSLNFPSALAFDSKADLWVTNAMANTVVEFTPTQLASSGTPIPTVTLTATNGSIAGPLGIAFDASGNLWISNAMAQQPNSVVKFAASQLAASGATTPAVVITASGGSLGGPVGLAFDVGGNLWVANATAGSVVEFAASQLATSGSPVPSVTLGGSSPTGAARLAFNPHPSNLPLK
jgi:sugar lactone lactonase YvrE